MNEASHHLSCIRGVSGDAQHAVLLAGFLESMLIELEVSAQSHYGNCGRLLGLPSAAA